MEAPEHPTIGDPFLGKAAIRTIVYVGIIIRSPFFRNLQTLNLNPRS